MVKKIGLSIMLLFFFLIIALPIYAWKIEPNLVHINQVTLGKKNQREPLNVVQLSDIQVSEFYETKRLDKVIKKSIVKNQILSFLQVIYLTIMPKIRNKKNR